MIYNPHTQKYFHFGSTMPDFTRHMDMDRRNKFLLRNHGWKHYDKYTPAYASYYLTWQLYPKYILHENHIKYKFDNQTSILHVLG